MTSREISEVREKWSEVIKPSMISIQEKMLLEIAYQLARLNEQIEEELLRQEHVRDNS